MTTDTTEMDETFWSQQVLFTNGAELNVSEFPMPLFRALQDFLAAKSEVQERISIVAYQPITLPAGRAQQSFESDDLRLLANMLPAGMRGGI